MNVSTAMGAAAIFASLAVSSASANVSDSRTLAALVPTRAATIQNADFVQGHEMLAGLQARQALVHAEASKAAAAQYFDFDVIVTLGALAIASGAFVAAGIAGSRRRFASGATASSGEGWREEVMQALETDLAQFTSGLRRAA
jgi:hypothetical protein